MVADARRKCMHAWAVCQPRWLSALCDWSCQVVTVVVAEQNLGQLLLSAVQCGLDRGKRGSHTATEEQEGIFEQQLQMAQELSRPVSVGSLHLPEHSVWKARRTELHLHWLVEYWAAMPACFAGPDVHTAGTKGWCCLKAWPATLQVHCVQHFGKLQQLLQKHGPFPAGAQA